MHTVLRFNTEAVFVVEVTDGGGVAFYANTGVSSKEGELTPPFARLRTTHQLVSPQHIHAEDDTNSRKLIKGKRGWRRRVQLISPVVTKNELGVAK